MSLLHSRAMPGVLVIVSLVVSLSEAPPAQAQSVADFYRGKTLTMLVGVGVGGEFDLLTRLLAKYIGRHIPGNPSTVTQNVVGASGMKVLNYLYNQAPRDGTYVVLVQPALPAAQAVGLPGVQYEAEKLRWIGTIAPSVETMVVWHTTGVKTIKDAREREIVIGATARGSNTYGFPALMKEFLGARFKIVTGYASGTQINLAMERGEVDGRDNSWASWKTTKPDWVKEHKINVIARFGPAVPDLDAPSVEEMVERADERRIVELVLSGGQLGRPFAAAPGVPQERVAALRAAFDAVMRDPDFLAEAVTLNFDVAPIGGEALQSIVERVVNTPKDLTSRARHFLE
jgi:tripartite-type tricarboxylate transporter receptor subunit TctC